MNPVFILLANEHDELITLNVAYIIHYRELNAEKSEYAKLGCKSKIELSTKEIIYVKESTAAIADKIDKAMS